MFLVVGRSASVQAIIAYVRNWVVRWRVAGVLALGCVVAACGLLLLRDADGSGGGAVPEAQTQDVLLAEVQQLRAVGEVGPLMRDLELDALAQRVLAEVLRLQCVCVANALAAIAGSSTDGAGGEGALAQGQAVALGWSLDAPGAVRAAGGTAGHAGVLADARWARVGIATLLCAGRRGLAGASGRVATVRVTQQLTR